MAFGERNPLDTHNIHFLHRRSSSAPRRSSPARAAPGLAQVSPGRASGGIASEIQQPVLGRSHSANTWGVCSPQVCLGAIAL